MFPFGLFPRRQEQEAREALRHERRDAQREVRPFMYNSMPHPHIKN